MESWRYERSQWSDYRCRLRRHLLFRMCAATRRHWWLDSAAFTPRSTLAAPRQHLTLPVFAMIMWVKLEHWPGLSTWPIGDKRAHFLRTSWVLEQSDALTIAVMAALQIIKRSETLKWSPVQQWPGFEYLNSLKRACPTVITTPSMRESWACCRISVKRHHAWLVPSHGPVIFPRVLPSSVPVQCYLFFPWRPTHHRQLLSISITHMCKGLRSLADAGREATRK